jgi:hypothetical protein
MEEFTDFESLDIQDISHEVINNFGQRYLMDAARVLDTQIVLPGDGHMIQLALAIASGLYMKQIVEDGFLEEKMH